VASILPFLKPSDGVFDDHATRVMGEAFDDALERLRSVGQSIAEQWPNLPPPSGAIL
jgi:hypothetical protein